jgi:regulatory factor X 1/2/3
VSIQLTPCPSALFVTCRLLQNYEYEENHSLSRQSVYEAYEVFCRQTGQPACNNASFGKLIRAVFPELKTRRLGTRGNSKVRR